MFHRSLIFNEAAQQLKGHVTRTKATGASILIQVVVVGTFDSLFQPAVPRLATTLHPSCRRRYEPLTIAR